MRMSGMHAVILMAEGYGEPEMWTAYYRFLEEGATVMVAGPKKGVVFGQGLRGRDGRKAEITSCVEELPPCDVLFIPGGHWCPMELRVHEPSLAYIRQTIERGGYVCAMEHAAWVLVSAEVVRGHMVCCTADVGDDVNNAGGTYLAQAGAVCDGALLTAKDFENMPRMLGLLMERLEADRAKGAIGAC